MHIAPEACLEPHLRKLADGCYLRADLLREDVDERFDILAIPHPDATFQGVYCSHVLQYVQDDMVALAEIFRVLKVGGWAIVNVPVNANAACTVDHRDAPLHPHDAVDPRPAAWLRTYGADFRDQLASVGFDVRVVNADDLATASAQKRFGIDTAAAGAIYFGVKRMD